MKKFSSTYIFAVLVLAIGAYTYFFEFKKAQEEKLLETEGIKLLRDFKEDEVTGVRWQKGTTDIELVKTEGVWNLTSPLSETADKYTVESLVSTLMSEKEEPIKADEGTSFDPKNYGFDAASGFIEIKTPKASKKIKVSSQKTFDGRQYHIMIDGRSEVLLASSTFGDVLDKPLKEFRGKEILGDLNPNKFAVQVEGKPETVLEKAAENWINPANRELKLDPKAITDWISALKYVKAHDFASDSASATDKNKFGLDKPTLRLRLTAEKKEIEVLAKIKDQKVFLVTSQRPIIYEVTTAMIAPLQKTLSDFRDKKFPFTFDESTVTRLEVSSPNLKVTLEKAKDQWKMAGTEKAKEVDQAILNSLVGKLRDLAVDRYLTSQDAVKGLNPPQSRLTLKDQTGKAVLDFSIGEKFVEGPDRFIYTRTNLAKENLVLKSSKIDDLLLEKIIKEPAKTDGKSL